MGNFVPIPSTGARLQPYITIRSIPGGVDISDLNTLATQLAANASSVKEIATINEISIEIKRETSIWREFSDSRRGLPREVVPGLPTYELTLKKIIMNKDLQNNKNQADNLMTLFGFDQWQAGFDIVSQNRPLLIYLELLSPRDANNALVPGYPASKTMVFYGCWFDSLPMKFSLSGTDMTIEQESKAKAAGVIML
jgi:hypothetical protein